MIDPASKLIEIKKLRSNIKSRILGSVLVCVVSITLFCLLEWTVRLHWLEVKSPFFWIGSVEMLFLCWTLHMPIYFIFWGLSKVKEIDHIIFWLEFIEGILQNKDSSKEPG